MSIEEKRRLEEVLNSKCNWKDKLIWEKWKKYSDKTLEEIEYVIHWVSDIVNANNHHLPTLWRTFKWFDRRYLATNTLFRKAA